MLYKHKIEEVLKKHNIHCSEDSHFNSWTQNENGNYIKLQLKNNKWLFIRYKILLETKTEHEPKHEFQIEILEQERKPNASQYLKAPGQGSDMNLTNEHNFKIFIKELDEQIEKYIGTQ